MAELTTPPKHHGVWLPYTEKGKASAVRSYGTYRPTYRMQIATATNPDRQAKTVVLQFPETGWCYIFEDTIQLLAVIEMLTTVYKQISGRGESRVVSYTNQPAMDGTP